MSKTDKWHALGYFDRCPGVRLSSSTKHRSRNQKDNFHMLWSVQDQQMSNVKSTAIAEERRPSNFKLRVVVVHARNVECSFFPKNTYCSIKVAFIYFPLPC